MDTVSFEFTLEERGQIVTALERTHGSPGLVDALKEITPWDAGIVLKAPRALAVQIAEQARVYSSQAGLPVFVVTDDEEAHITRLKTMESEIVAFTARRSAHDTIKSEAAAYIIKQLDDLHTASYGSDDAQNIFELISETAIAAALKLQDIMPERPELMAA
jgi:predicted nucleic acid-binding Zn ribbon protein